MKGPFIGLTPFSENNAEFFFGRTDERDLIIANLTARRLTLLYGPSGVGKTSLLEAGVVTHARATASRNLETRGKPGIVPVSFSTWPGAPLRSVAEAIRAAVTKVVPGFERGDAGTLEETLERWTAANNGDLLIILDQFEQFFIHQTGEARTAFVQTFAACVSRRDLAAHFLVSIREDWLSSLDIFKGRVPGLFDNYLRLRPLGYASARLAIEEPIRAYNERFGGKVTLDPALVDAVLSRCQKTARRLQPGEVARPRGWSLRRWLPLRDPGVGLPARPADLDQGSFDTPAIQLIMARLWEEEVRNNSGALSSATLGRLTRRQDIVDEYVDRVLGALSFRRRTLTVKLLDRLVTPAGTKIAQTRSNLALFLGSSERELDGLLETLTARPAVLNNVTPPRDVDEPCYEIAHDVLAVSLARWQARQVQWRRLTAVLGVVLVVVGVLGAFLLREINSQRRLAQAFGQLKTVSDTNERIAGELQTKNAALTDALKQIEVLQRLATSRPPGTGDPTSTVIAANPADPTPEPTARGKLWANGQTLRVRFLDGSDQLRQRVRSALSQWTDFANIHLRYVDTGDAEVRISFRERGNWSYVGLDALATPQAQPTVNYGEVNERTPDDQFNAAVLHEFGHTLGLVHEFSQRNASIPWNKEVVYKEMQQGSGWSRAVVDANFFRRDGSWLPSKPFDPASIMMFAFPASWTTTGVGYEQPTQLSPMDKAYIARLYPRTN